MHCSAGRLWPLGVSITVQCVLLITHLAAIHRARAGGEEARMIEYSIQTPEDCITIWVNRLLADHPNYNGYKKRFLWLQLCESNDFQDCNCMRQYHVPYFLPICLSPATHGMGVIESGVVSSYLSNT